MGVTTQEIEAFQTLLKEHEEWLMKRILGYAEQYDYTKFTSTLMEAWRISIEQLSESLIALMQQTPQIPELAPEEDYSNDAAAQFGMLEAQRHRSRGVNLSMFLGLFKYYRQTYKDFIKTYGESLQPTEYYIHYVERFFDRTEIAYCTEWAGMSSEKQILELSQTNLTMTNEKNRYLTVFDSFGSAVFLLDSEGFIINLNFAAEKIFFQKEVPGSHYYKEIKSQQKFTWIEEEIEEFVASDTHEVHFEKIYDMPQEHPTYFDVHIQKMHDVSKKFVGYTVLLNDITELKNAQERLRELDRLKSNFIASMSHELRTPMNAILGFAQLLKRNTHLDSEAAESVEVIDRSGKYLLSLINDVLDMSKIESGTMSLELKNVKSEALLGNICNMMRIKAEEKGLIFTMHVQNDLPEFLRVDEQKLSQVLINLLGNAIKFTEQGSVTFTVAYAAGNLEVEVQDTGVGIAQKDLERIFKPFTQTGRSIKQKEGTGLGLAISNRFIELMHGTFNVVSTPNEGSRFSVVIPIEEAEASVERSSNSYEGVVGLANTQVRKKIMVVEDNDENRLLLGRLLKSVGLDVLEVTNGQEACDAFETYRPDLIWMDMRMSVMDGFEATRKIKQTLLGSKTPIIALTASVFDDEKERVFEAGCDGFVRKPFRESEIFEEMANHLNVHYTYSQTTNAGSVTATYEKVLTKERFCAMPIEVRHKLEFAALELNSEKIAGVLKQWESADQELCDAILYLIHNFNYEQLLTHIEECNE